MVILLGYFIATFWIDLQWINMFWFLFLKLNFKLFKWINFDFWMSWWGGESWQNGDHNLLSDVMNACIIHSNTAALKPFHLLRVVYRPLVISPWSGLHAQLWGCRVGWRKNAYPRQYWCSRQGYVFLHCS